LLAQFHSKCRNQPSFPALVFEEELITPSDTDKHIGAILDKIMSSYINDVCRRSFLHLRNIAKISRLFSFSTTEILIHAFVTSKVDTYNALVFGVPI